VKGTSKLQDEKTTWYENFKPIQEYLGGEFSKKSNITENDPKTVKGGGPKNLDNVLSSESA
jgi:hypothetical protein